MAERQLHRMNDPGNQVCAGIMVERSTWQPLPPKSHFPANLPEQRRCVFFLADECLLLWSQSCPIHWRTIASSPDRRTGNLDTLH